MTGGMGLDGGVENVSWSGENILWMRLEENGNEEWSKMRWVAQCSKDYKSSFGTGNMKSSRQPGPADLAAEQS